MQYITVPEPREPKPTAKTSTLTFRIDPVVKEALRTAAEQGHCSITNMVEVLIRDYCQQHNVVLNIVLNKESRQARTRANKK